jgi:hypothetical protein
MAIFIFQTEQSEDDGYENVATGAMSLTDQGTTEPPHIDGLYHFLARFPNVTIPQGEAIQSARVWFDQLNNFTGTGGASGNVYMQDADNAAILTTSASDISARGRTSSAATNPAATGTLWQTNGIPVTAQVQAVLNRAGWASGNAMAFMFIGSGVEGSFVQPYLWDYFSGTQYRTRLEIITPSPDQVLKTKRRILRPAPFAPGRAR